MVPSSLRDFKRRLPEYFISTKLKAWIWIVRRDAAGQWVPARREDGCPYDESPDDLARLKASVPTPREAVAYILDTLPSSAARTKRNTTATTAPNASSSNSTTPSKRPSAPASPTSRPSPRSPGRRLIRCRIGRRGRPGRKAGRGMCMGRGGGREMISRFGGRPTTANV
jgi:hypothetical protein